MEDKELRNSRDDQIHGFRSFGSNYLPSSQSRKISIGVMADVTEKKISGAKKDGAALNTAEKEVSCKNLVEENFKQISTKSLHQPTETVQFHAKEPPVLQSNNVANIRSNSVNETPIKKIIRFDANWTSSPKNINYGRRRKKGRSIGKVEELAVAAVQESNELHRGEQEEKAAHQSNNALRMKLSEILGSVPSPNKKSFSFETPHIGVKDLKLEGQVHQKSIEVANDRLNSDTIETDSVSPRETIMRPVTRSLSRKKPPTKSVQKSKYSRENLSHSPVSRCGQKRRNIYSFSEAEVWSRSLHVATNISNSSFIFKKGEKNCGKFEQKKCVSHMITPHKSQQTTDKGKTSSPAQKIPPQRRTESFHGHSHQDDKERLKSMNGVTQEIHNSPARKKRFQQEDCKSSQLSREAGPQEDFHCFSSKKNEDPQFDVKTQTLGMETPIKNCFPGSPDPKSKQTEQGAHSPSAAERRPMEEVFCGPRTLWTSKVGSFRFDIETEFSDDFEKPKAPSIRKLSPAEEDKESGGRTSQSSSSEEDADSFEEDPAIKKGATSTWTPESDNCETSSFLLHPRKRRHGQGGIRINDLSSSLPYLKGTQESNGLEGPSDGNRDDCLARGVAFLASALERVRTKMKSLMTQRCTELLASVAEETQLQLQNVESQIAKDIEKFTSLEESKRKSMGKKFQEKQERLNLIYEKFKEDMNKHLEDCRSTLEELEIYQREQKGNAGKLKSLHRKLLLQVEEGIGSQLSDAERRIMNVQKAARQKMFQLRHVIREL